MLLIAQEIPGFVHEVGKEIVMGDDVSDIFDRYFCAFLCDGVSQRVAVCAVVWFQGCKQEIGRI